MASNSLNKTIELQGHFFFVCYLWGRTYNLKQCSQQGSMQFDLVCIFHLLSAWTPAPHTFFFFKRQRFLFIWMLWQHSVVWARLVSSYRSKIIPTWKRHLVTLKETWRSACFTPLFSDVLIKCNGLHVLDLMETVPGKTGGGFTLAVKLGRKRWSFPIVLRQCVN